MTATIRVWNWGNCPKKYRKLVDSDDIDWIAFVPDAYGDEYITWLDEPYFGCCWVHDQKVKGGTLYEGHHS